MKGLEAKIGQITMDNELLREKIVRLEGWRQDFRFVMITGASTSPMPFKPRSASWGSIALPPSFGSLRAMVVLKESLLCVRTIRTIDEVLCLGLLELKDLYSTRWLIERHGDKTSDQIREEQRDSL